MKDICDWAGTNTSQKNFVQGEKIINSNHIVCCGKTKENEESFTLKAWCISTSNLRGDPHTINGEISNNGKVLSMQCSCKAESSRCKHIVGTLLYCYK